MNSEVIIWVIEGNRKLLLRNNDLKFNDLLFGFSEWPLKSLIENNNPFKTMKKSLIRTNQDEGDRFINEGDY